jgi:hypothetical protein
MVTLAAQATTQGQKPPLPRGTHRATVKVSGRRLLRYLRNAEGAGPRRPHRCDRPRRAANLSIAFGTALSAIADDRVLLGTVPSPSPPVMHIWPVSATSDTAANRRMTRPRRTGRRRAPASDVVSA